MSPVKLLDPLVPPVMTTAQRDAIPAGRRPKGSQIFNTTTNRVEVNLGTDASPIWLPPSGPINIQSIWGTNEAYSSLFTGTGEIQLYADNVNPLRILYTPPVNAWWEPFLHLGLISKQSAEYTYMYGGVKITPGDVDGRTNILNLVTQHASVQQFEGRFASTMFKLAAGTAYQLDGIVTGGSGGTWNYFIGKHQLEMHAKAYAR